MNTKQTKQLRELSEEELKNVTGGTSVDCSRKELQNTPACKAMMIGLAVGAIPVFIAGN